MLLCQTYNTKAVCSNLRVEQLGIDTLRSRDLALAWWGACLAEPLVEGMKRITHCSFTVSSYHCLFLCSALGTHVPLQQLNHVHA